MVTKVLIDNSYVLEVDEDGVGIDGQLLRFGDRREGLAFDFFGDGEL